MRLQELAIVYGAVGIGWLAMAWLRRHDAKMSVAESLLLALLWPLYAPFWLARLKGDAPSAPGDDPREQALLRTLLRARGTLFEAVLPNEATCRHIAHRLRVAEDKVREIDGLLGQPAFQESAAIARRDQLIARDASFFAIQAADKRLQSIHKLRRLRERFITEIDEVDELIAQLTAQTEVLRIAGEQDPQVQEWISELLLRVESLDVAMNLQDEPPDEQPDASHHPLREPDNRPEDASSASDRIHSSATTA